jgi:NAD(P)H-dependent FMN reductase
MENIGIILASVRDGRKGEGFARWIYRVAGTKPAICAELVDLRDWPLPPYSSSELAPTREPQLVPDSLEGRWAALVQRLDAFVIVTPEYNHGYPGQLKNALDALYPAWGYKPVGFVGYGGFAAGTRAIQQLAHVAIELRMVPLRDQVALRTIGLPTDEHGAPTEELYQKRARAMLDELAWWSGVLREARTARTAR